MTTQNQQNTTNNSADKPAEANERYITQRLEELSRASLSISSELDLNSLLQLIADTARDYARCKYAAVGVVDNKGVITNFITSGISQEVREKIGDPPRGHGLLGVLIKQGKPLRVRDMSKDPRSSGFPPNHPPMTSLLGVPISLQNRIVGDLYLTDKVGSDEFSESDVWWVTLLAQQAAVAIQNATLYTQMKEVERMKEEFLSMITHDLKTPLTAIKMSAGLLEANLPNHQIPAPLLSLVANISRNSERLSTLLTDLLDITRLEQGHLRLNIERIRVRDVVNVVVTTIAPLIEDKEQHLELDFPPKVHWVNADRRRLEQVLVNLISNASKYSPAGGSITIQIRGDYERKFITVKVADDGPGIPPEEAEKIFNRFYRRAIHEQTSETSGSGLGLSIARSLVELHGGKLWVESEVGKGSAFFVSLPFERAEDYKE
ncbi:MAG TPA: GAF domain-containing sensor histidine kinase [Chloroflexia bacterium]|nr:GAF domain-containing sensor histidine kinase [Chloroflexia bacterium]